MSTVRTDAVKSISNAKHCLTHIDFKQTHLKDLFASNVFNEAQMQAACPSRSTRTAEDHQAGAPLDPAIADAVATAMKDWAIEQVRPTTRTFSSP